jgi:hypothetical protein
MVEEGPVAETAKVDPKAAIDGAPVNVTVGVASVAATLTLVEKGL